LKLKKDKVQEILKSDFYNNYHRFASALDVDASQLHKYIKHEVGGGKKLIGAIAKFCQKNELDFQEYIEL
jgi:hypothetical protein